MKYTRYSVAGLILAVSLAAGAEETAITTAMKPERIQAEWHSGAGAVQAIIADGIQSADLPAIAQLPSFPGQELILTHVKLVLDLQGAAAEMQLAQLAMNRTSRLAAFRLRRLDELVAQQQQLLATFVAFDLAAVPGLPQVPEEVPE